MRQTVKGPKRNTVLRCPRVFLALFGGVLSVLFTVWPMMAAARIGDTAEGFHWYTQTPTEDTRPASNAQPDIEQTQSAAPKNATEALHRLTEATKNTMSKALLNPTVKNTAAYMRAQQFWAKRDQKFVQSWQQALLLHPELDYQLNFPTDNGAIALRNDAQNKLLGTTLNQMSKRFGLIVFYQGRALMSQKFLSILLPFADAHHFAMVSVTTDDTPIVGLPNPRAVPLFKLTKSLNLQARYLPAVYLVDLKRRELHPLSYGFISRHDLALRCLDVLTHFKRYSYQGLKTLEEQTQ